MTTESTRPTRLARQGAAFRFLAQMAVLHPDLPGAYVVVHDARDVSDPYVTQEFPAKVNVQVDGQDFETWRVTLGINHETVTLHTSRSFTWVAADTVLNDVPVHLTGYMSTRLAPEQLNAPRDREQVPA